MTLCLRSVKGDCTYTSTSPTSSKSIFAKVQVATTTRGVGRPGSHMKEHDRQEQSVREVVRLVSEPGGTAVRETTPDWSKMSWPITNVTNNEACRGRDEAQRGSGKSCTRSHRNAQSNIKTVSPVPWGRMCLATGSEMKRWRSSRSSKS